MNNIKPWEQRVDLTIYGSRADRTDAAVAAMRAEIAELRAAFADQDRTLRASVPERWKNCTSPVGAAQSYIAELEEALAAASHQQQESVSETAKYAQYECHHCGAGLTVHKPQPAQDAVDAAKDHGTEAQPVGEVVAINKDDVRYVRADLAAAAPSPSLAVRDVVEVRQQDILDAARYRWLRDKARSVDWTRHLDANSYQIECRIGAVKMDTDIDAAMREKP